MDGDGGNADPTALSLSSHSGQVAQLVEHVTENHGVGSSILPLAIPIKPIVLATRDSRLATDD